jgi:hypothetical protein
MGIGSLAVRKFHLLADVAALAERLPAAGVFCPYYFVYSPMHDNRKIIHIDMAACSYGARKFGIHSAIACATVYKRCPHAVFIRPRFDAFNPN